MSFEHLLWILKSCPRMNDRDQQQISPQEISEVCFLPAAEMPVLLGRDEDSFRVLAVLQQSPRGALLTLLIFTFE